MTHSDKKHSCGYVALAGRANVGKSTMLNAIIGQKLSIVSRVPQTTRNRILAVHNMPGFQIILVDTPGIHKGRKAINRYMRKTAMSAAKEADVVVLLVEPPFDDVVTEADAVNREDADLLDNIRKNGKPVIVAVNKVDLMKSKSALLMSISRFSAVRGVKAVIPVSALKNDGVSELLKEVAAHLPEGYPLYPQDMLTDQAERFFVSELVREAVIEETRMEVPHSTAVTVESFKEDNDGSCSIRAVIHVETESQKGIIVGRGGSRIKSIGVRARKKAEEFLGCRVHLFLRAVTSPEWSRDEVLMGRLGYK